MFSPNFCEGRKTNNTTINGLKWMRQMRDTNASCCAWIACQQHVQNYVFSNIRGDSMFLSCYARETPQGRNSRTVQWPSFPKHQITMDWWDGYTASRASLWFLAALDNQPCRCILLTLGVGIINLFPQMHFVHEKWGISSKKLQWSPFWKQMNSTIF